MLLWHPPHELGQSLALECIGKFMCAVKVFALFATTLASSKTINAMLVFHPRDVYPPCLDSLLDFHPNSKFKLFVHVSFVVLWSI
jgi:hypothetical protein